MGGNAAKKGAIAIPSSCKQSLACCEAFITFLNVLSAPEIIFLGIYLCEVFFFPFSPTPFNHAIAAGFNEQFESQQIIFKWNVQRWSWPFCLVLCVFWLLLSPNNNLLSSHIKKKITSYFCQSYNHPPAPQAPLLESLFNPFSPLMS